jgi:hypothetical protein
VVEHVTVTCYDKAGFRFLGLCPPDNSDNYLAEVTWTG